MLICRFGCTSFAQSRPESRPQIIREHWQTFNK